MSKPNRPVNNNLLLPPSPPNDKNSIEYKEWEIERITEKCNNERKTKRILYDALLKLKQETTKIKQENEILAQRAQAKTEKTSHDYLEEIEEYKKTLDKEREQHNKKLNSLKKAHEEELRILRNEMKAMADRHNEHQKQIKEALSLLHKVSDSAVEEKPPPVQVSSQAVNKSIKRDRSTLSDSTNNIRELKKAAVQQKSTIIPLKPKQPPNINPAPAPSKENTSTISHTHHHSHNHSGDSEMVGTTCMACAKFYGTEALAMNVNRQKTQITSHERIQLHSRHRQHRDRGSTPPGFWDLDFSPPSAK